MSIEQRKVWQVIHKIENLAGGETATQHVKTISPHLHEDGEYFDEVEDSYNQLIEEEDDEPEEEEDIISYDSESSNLDTPMEPTATLLRPPIVLDLATTNHSSNGGVLHSQAPPTHQIHLPQQHIQVSPRLVYVKLGDPSDHVIAAVNRPMADDLSRMLTNANTVVNMTNTEQNHGTTIAARAPNTTTTTTNASTGNDEELTSLTWLQDKNLIQGKECSPLESVRALSRDSNYS